MSPVQQTLEQAKTHHQAGHFHQAEEFYRQVLRDDPRQVEALHLLGVLAHQTGRNEAAIQYIGQALQCDCNQAVLHNNLGAAYQALGQFDESESCYRAAIRCRPDYAAAHNNLGVVLVKQRRLDEAVSTFQYAVHLQYDYAAAHKNLANALRALGRFDESVASSRQALFLRPNDAEAYCNLGNAFQDQGRLDEALAAYQQAVRIRPDFADAHCSLGAALLLLGDCERGWREYEWRWQCKDASLPPFQQPRWDGSPLEGRTILLHAEQGFGDTLQFIRYAPLVKQCGGTVLMACPTILARLLGTCPGIDRVIPHGSVLPPFEVHSPLMSLPHIVNTTSRTVPATVPYLFGNAAVAAHWREHLAGLQGLKIGIAWQGNLNHPGDGRRSIPLKQFAPLAELAGVRLVSLQYGPGREQLQDPGPGFNILDVGGPLEEMGGDFLDTAGALQHLDLVICCDTALAHLAGALGRPVWVALPFAPDWRWLLERPDSPWYPTMRLFRQRQPGCWSDVFERLAAEVRKQASARDEAEAHNALGFAHSEQQKFEEAAASFTRALNLKPDFAEARTNLGNALWQQGRLDEAVRCHRQALSLRPDYAEAHNNLGVVLKQQGRLDEALACYHEALRLKPQFAGVHNNLGVLYKQQGRVEEAIAYYEQALRFAPDYAEAHKNLATAWLLHGDFEKGWQEFEWRWKCREFKLPPFQQPKWNGSPISGQKILLYAEQGLGDTLQFIRYARLVKARGGNTLVACPGALARLLTSCPGVDEVIPLSNASVDCAFYIPLMSLPTVFETTPATIPAQVPYLSADAALVARWRHELTDVPGLKIGIAWQGNPKHPGDRQRSFRLAQFAPVAALPGVHLVSLQRGAAREQLQAPGPGFAVLDVGSRLEEAAGDFLDTAAVVQNLDLVISCDTALAHLAGALGVPVWTALPVAPDWRWLLERQDSPWYPTMRLFRQKERGNWPDVFQRITAEVQKRLQAPVTMVQASENCSTQTEI
jgi:tetratricopeptide (TPR) repeat protein